MNAPRIIPYQPNAETQTQRIYPMEWERLRPRLEELYVNEDKKLEEVMETMSLSGFRASRKQYKRKFDDWGLRKNFSSKVMKSALRKRARAGERDMSIKYKATAITKENMDRWQKRVSTFNPLSSPTASTPSQLNMDSPHVALSPQQGYTFRSAVAPSQPINPCHERNVEFNDDEDDVISDAYYEIRHSNPPQVAPYIFERKHIPSLLTTRAGWTCIRHLAFSVNENELLQLTEDNVRDLMRLTTTIWTLGQITRSFNRLVNAYRASGSRSLAYVTARASVGLDKLRNECQSFLGMLRLQAGQHDSAIDLCAQAVMLSRSKAGLSHHVTWLSYATSSALLGIQGGIEPWRRMMLEFYGDIYLSLSARLLPAFCASLELCESYLQRWMSETNLQKLIRSRSRYNPPFDKVFKIHFLMIKTVFTAGLGMTAFGSFSKALADLQGWTGLGTRLILETLAGLVNRQIDMYQLLEPSSLLQKALQVVKDLRVTKFLVPLFVFTFLTYSELHSSFKDWERDLINFLQKVGTYRANPTEAYVSTSLENASSSEFVSSVGTAHQFSPTTSPDWLQTTPDFSEPANLGSPWNATSATESWFNGITTANALPSPTLIQPGPGLPTALVQPRTHVGLDPMANDTRQPELSVNIEPSVYPSVSPVQSGHWFSPSATFLLPDPLYPEEDPFPVLRPDPLYPHDQPFPVLRPEPLYPDCQPSPAQSGHWLSPSATFLRPDALYLDYQPTDDPRPQNRVSAIEDLSSYEFDSSHLVTENFTGSADRTFRGLG